jgi:hypothetical protein
VATKKALLLNVFGRCCCWSQRPAASSPARLYLRRPTGYTRQYEKYGGGGNRIPNGKTKSGGKQMKTAQWVKKLGGHAGECYVAAELSKRGIANALLPENFTAYDLIAGKMNGSLLCFIQVKACHPDRSHTFPLQEKNDQWVNGRDNEFVVFVYLGSPAKNEGPRYWIATKKQVGEACKEIGKHQAPHNKERRFHLYCKTEGGCAYCLKKAWENNWELFDHLIGEEPILGVAEEGDPSESE